MTNCPALASLLGVGCMGGHEHYKLEGSKRTAQASKYPTTLVTGILNTVKKVKKSFKRMLIMQGIRLIL